MRECHEEEWCNKGKKKDRNGCGRENKANACRQEGKVGTCALLLLPFLLLLLLLLLPLLLLLLLFPPSRPPSIPPPSLSLHVHATASSSSFPLINATRAKSSPPTNSVRSICRPCPSLLPLASSSTPPRLARQTCAEEEVEGGGEGGREGR